MSRQSILALCALLSACVDRGVCLQSHKEEYEWLQPIYVGNTYCGNNCSTPIFIYIPQTGVQTVCDQWQFPKGKP